MATRKTKTTKATTRKTTTKKGTGRKRAAAAKAKPAKQAKAKMSGLDAAAKVLADADEPLRCAEIVKRMLDGGLWKTSGKTPAATIYAAILREIRAKGKDARFKKTDRGLFTANG